MREGGVPAGVLSPGTVAISPLLERVVLSDAGIKRVTSNGSVEASSTGTDVTNVTVPSQVYTRLNVLGKLSYSQTTVQKYYFCK
jgi:hypothetical protein